MSKVNQRQNFATELVKAPKEHYKMLFDIAPVGLIEGIWGKTFEVINCNTAAMNIFKADSREEFLSTFYMLLGKIPPKLLLELLSARVKGDFFEAELKLPTFKRNHVHVFMRLVYMPAVHAVSPQHVVIAVHDITERKKYDNIIKRLSQIDGLTQVLNRRAILQRLDEELSRAKRYELNLSCVLLDVDNFKTVNDTFGHLAGDKCMKNTVAALKDSMRKTDIIGRFGGDEFLVILPETKPEQAVVPVQRFLDSSQVKTEVKKKDKSVTITFSIGISGFPSSGALTAKDLVDAADKVLYMSKRSGGNKYQVYTKNSVDGPRP